MEIFWGLGKVFSIWLLIVIYLVGWAFATGDRYSKFSVVWYIVHGVIVVGGLLTWMVMSWIM